MWVYEVCYGATMNTLDVKDINNLEKKKTFAQFK